MSKHTKIPPPGKDKDKTNRSMIERAVKAFDLGRFAPPPVPDQLAPSRPVRPVASQDVPSDAGRSVDRERRQYAPERSEREPVETLQPEPPVVVEKPREPVRFSDAIHKVDRQHLREQGLIVPESSVTALLEEFRIVKRHILVQASDLRRQSSGAGAAQRVLVCSALPGEGKTYCAVNLALSIASEKESEVLLVDADFGKPSVLNALGLSGNRGLMDALSDPSVDVADLVITTDIPGLRVLPAGIASHSDSEFLRSSRTASVLDRLTDGAPNRIVIFDSPPALAASPAAELAKYVGQALVVVRADRTAQGAVEDALSLLSACPNIELLLNAAHFSPSGRRFGTYYGYRG
jgi:exopolysaccharide/PEP-CTERM locus tyrosine autokinase